ncbi:MAG: bifunctional phosphoribosylaminoimidazolecarboxamide formyltransferase/inosine monophosphate cyclohydrolase [Euryarchaeota archaeon]|jgi:phosphoribosylaminoimidazolecarboxamide formyltransferase/IMP cyclohydrolase|nr:bifunctional phosphoribosylaminoimidazolecarboxamide formyltransferase/inosine monophosphate cyclohydrolase [Euryarchaeota archaeon]MDP6364063.1 bifunctional phosphoribosylaminoimidazolecarboxamide formyltransferase/IMP cyclohydrolase [Candidatus Poseidoniia archaeon]MDP6846395.1 bifunctional phosphoribosylaminoimidazolecarboxamide formyltransferase/IMP cyclohydrolase [Candidatus Poseidoniia archaeon]|tara:strand:- start:2102 stop:3646 length:1545 start_codon:yes stop_codon:yes gene_type:complete
MSSDKTPRRALLSVSDKTGLVEFAGALTEAEWELVASGGTAAALRDAGLAVTPVSEITGFPEMMGGRVKTLHPRIFGGILAREQDFAEAAEHDMPLFGVVAVNLYPFAAAARRDAPLPELVEQIDIGGPSLIRAAAKNHARVVVLVDPADYERVAGALVGDALSAAERQALALKAFRHTASYDALIQRTLGDRFGDAAQPLPESLHVSGELALRPCYGENPHQQAAFYADPLAAGPGLGSAEQLQGKELSYNNLLDLDAALAIAADFPEPAAAVVKHGNPCGAATAPELAAAYESALAGDPVSAFGGVIGLNREVDAETAAAIAAAFKECVIAPSFSDAAREVLGAKPNLRLLATGALDDYHPAPQLRSVAGGWLLQEGDAKTLDDANIKVASDREPTDAEWKALRFGWRVVKYVRSNAIVLASSSRTTGVGAGQMSRVDSVRIAIEKAGDAARGSVMASDAFFPFRDGIELAAAAGVTAVIQPGGSIRDDEVIAAANEQEVALVLTGMRHFRH